jgi:hypothetical protein
MWWVLGLDWMLKNWTTWQTCIRVDIWNEEKHNLFHYGAFHYSHTRGYTKTSCWLKVEPSWSTCVISKQWKASALHFPVQISFPLTQRCPILPQNFKCECDSFGPVPNCILLARPFCLSSYLLLLVREIYFKKRAMFTRDVALQSVALFFRPSKSQPVVENKCEKSCCGSKTGLHLASLLLLRAGLLIRLCLQCWVWRMPVICSTRVSAEIQATQEWSVIFFCKL